ncbi:hypothetical protein PG984_007564 [Apiospora sp. TS-2023a]
MSSTGFQGEPATLLTKKPTATPASYVALAITSASRSRRASCTHTRDLEKPARFTSLGLEVKQMDKIRPYLVTGRLQRRTPHVHQTWN